MSLARWGKPLSRRLRSGIALATLGWLLAVPATRAQTPGVGPGISRALALHRRAAIAELRYHLSLAIPEVRSAPVNGTVTIGFRLLRRTDVVLDFRAPPANVGSITVNGKPVTPLLSVDHITIPAAAVVVGSNRIEVAFIATDLALNRREEFFYALFVPDRASTAFPCFDQPDLKARIQLTLTVPTSWNAVANGSVIGADTSGSTRQVRFAETEPISSYLISFAAGRLRQEEAVRDGRRFTMYHRETDSAKVARNRDAVFDLHAAALRWLEDYTGIPYPFEKFDFFAIPAFQFGGMEHPGAVWYNASSLFLERAATRTQLLGRASLIAHETAHMWFGDLVTMRWFDDVWMKEVFANFMAAKIVEPAFPDLNHQLRFFLAHHPTASDVDRTAGTNPIRQPLDNLADAGSLYGAIIYQKAPIVMRQLELRIGPTAMRDGLRRYLAAHRYANADWGDLIAVLGRIAGDDLGGWSRAWVERAGRPTVRIERAGPKTLRLVETDPAARRRNWPQDLSLALVDPDTVRTVVARLRGGGALVRLEAEPRLILAAADGVGYGRFVLDDRTLERLPDDAARLANPLHRSVAWQALAEEMLASRLGPDRLVDAVVAALPQEPDPLISQQLQNLLAATFWRFLSAGERNRVAAPAEAALWQALAAAAEPGRKASFFNSLVNLTTTPHGTGRLERIWRRADSIPGLPLEEAQFTSLAEALALRRVPDAEAILDEQEARITNPDRRDRFRFVRQALAPNESALSAVYDRFRDVEQRRRESWVLETLGYLNHPLRAADAIGRLAATLALIDEVKRTGDIFMPTGWLLGAMSGHQSAAAASIVAEFLAHHDLPPRLRGKALQAADGLFRAARRLDGWQPPPGTLGEVESPRVTPKR
ncbi:MAG: hypothetical protein FJ206_09560 [Gemmatimonadetes bacterium]|nr:hypothetical protein [Gemmatimonadota bacterium]